MASVVEAMDFARHCSANGNLISFQILKDVDPMKDASIEEMYRALGVVQGLSLRLPNSRLVFSHAKNIHLLLALLREHDLELIAAVFDTLQLVLVDAIPSMRVPFVLFQFVVSRIIYRHLKMLEEWKLLLNM